MHIVSYIHTKDEGKHQNICQRGSEFQTHATSCMNENLPSSVSE